MDKISQRESETGNSFKPIAKLHLKINRNDWSDTVPKSTINQAWPFNWWPNTESIIQVFYWFIPRTHPNNLDIICNNIGRVDGYTNFQGLD